MPGGEQLRLPLGCEADTVDVGCACRTGERVGERSCAQPLRQDPADIDTLKELIAAGKLKPVIDRRSRLDQIAEAYAFVLTQVGG